ncbi:MAG TPA: cyclic nucleotide-binding domain-containing protein [Acidimicrobiales bacterium]|jgi:CRP-like cAMP-binding protein|nr:cyclic nucleotide-binding domain-containing protein [Acidimicrobiales bacterium]
MRLRLLKNESSNLQELRDFALFSNASRAELADIARLLTRITIPAGKVLMREGSHGDEFMIVASGTADVAQGGHVIATVGQGDLVGEMALVQDRGRGRRNATVTATSDMDIYVGSPREFRQILNLAPAVAETVHETIASRSLTAA